MQVFKISEVKEIIKTNLLIIAAILYLTYIKLTLPEF
jgi:hypothetical protein